MNESVLPNLGWPFLGVLIEIILLHLEAQTWPPAGISVLATNDGFVSII